MIINRHNYEEFFLLYNDGELDSDQRVVVEKFLEENPDLAGELQILQQVTLPEETVQFNGKELLYKKENGISLGNYEEYFLLSIDDELNDQEQRDVEKFVLKHPDLQNQFTLLKQAKLEPALILFADKKELYRQEKVRRIIPVTWMRMSVAAAVLGLAIALWIFKPDSTAPAVATMTSEETKVTSPKTEQVIKPATAAEQAVVVLPQKKGSVVEPNSAIPDLKRPIGKTEPVREIKMEKNIAVDKPQPEQADRIGTGNKRISEEISSPLEPKYQEPAALASGSNSSINKDVISETPAKSSFVSDPDWAEERSLVRNTLYSEIEADEEDKTIYIGAARINKNKLKGLFKKATGFLDKKIGRNASEKLLQ